MTSLLINLIRINKNVFSFVLLIVLCITFACKAQNLLNKPQKIVIDKERNRLLVSNFGTGDIIQIDSSGNQRFFKRNAEFNDGMEIVGNTVYGAYFSWVGGQGKVKGYDLDTRQLVMEINLDYVICTSSITADSSGHLYISEDLGTSIIKLRLSDLAHWVFTESQGLNHPNGMIYEHDNNRLVVCEDRPNPSIMAVSLLDSSVTTLTTTTLAGSDGIARDINGIYYLTGYFLNGIYRFDSDFSEPPQLIFYGSGIPFPTYDPSDNSLLITYFELDDWARVPIPVSNVYHFTDQIKGFELFQNYPNPFNP
jgi:sugar lactone lactonase YvrE